MIILLIFFIHGKSTVIIKSGPVRVKIIGLLLEICLLAVIRYKFVTDLMRRSIKLMKQGVFRSLFLRCGPVCGQWWGMQFGGLDYDYHIPCYHVA